MIKHLAAGGAVLGMVGVILGAFGAHAMRARLSPELLDVWQTAVQYQLWHVLAVLAIAALGAQLPGTRLLAVAGWTMVAGVVVFSGSLYLLAATGMRGVGAVTPVGGALLVAGWALLAWALLRLP